MQSSTPANVPPAWNPGRVWLMPSCDVITAAEVDTLETILEKMLQGGLHRLPVVRDRKPVGMVTRHDLLRLMIRHFPQAAEK
jgi:CBS domain-containing protein